MKPPNKKQILHDEIDTRMHALILQYLDEEYFDPDTGLAYLRAAYACGYADACREPDEVRGKWCRKLGYTV